MKNHVNEIDGGSAGLRAEQLEMDLVQLNSRVPKKMKQAIKAVSNLAGTNMEIITADAFRFYLGVGDAAVKERREAILVAAGPLLKGKHRPFDNALIVGARGGVSVASTKPLTVRLKKVKLTTPNRLGS